MRDAAMKSGVRAFCVFAAVFAVAFALERAFVPHVVPVAFAEQPQPLWTVETAFVIRALELMSGVAVIALGLMLAAWTRTLGQAGLAVIPNTVRSSGSRHPPSRSIP
jgi:hypothetical protein